MDDYESLSHTKWECKYHVVFIPKYRRKVLYGELRQYLGDVFRKLALQKESKIEQGHLMPRRIRDTGVHQKPGAGGQAPGPTQPVALIAACRRIKQWGRVS